MLSKGQRKSQKWRRTGDRPQVARANDELSFGPSDDSAATTEPSSGPNLRSCLPCHAREMIAAE